MRDDPRPTLDGPAPELVEWCALGPELVLAVVEIGRAGDVVAEPLDGSGSFPLGVRRLDPPGLAVVVLRGTDDAHPCGGMRFAVGDRIATWSAADLAAGRVDPDDLVVDHLCARSDADRVGVLQLVVDPVVVGADGGHDAGVALHRLREALRPRHRIAVATSGTTDCGSVDVSLRVDDHTRYLRGWLGWPERHVRRVTVVTAEGERVEVATLVRRHARRDADAFVGVSDRDRVGEPRGFSILLTTVGASTLDHGWLVEVEAIDGSVAEIPVPNAVGAIGQVRDDLVAELALDDDHDRWEQQIAPALSRLAERRTRAVRIDDVLQFGQLAPDPIATVVVPLYRRIDLMEYQLAQFSIDPAMHDADLVYVLDSPEQSEELTAAARRWSRLYRVPFRLALLTQNGGFSLANNLGVGLAAANDLVLCNSDVVPERPGWLPALRAARDRATRELGTKVGAVGPQLLYEDDSLQHAGMYFARTSPDDPWTNEHYFKGLHRSFAPAGVAREVPAVTAACMLVERDRYDGVGGLDASYVQGDYEDSDLCLRLRAEGAPSWYAADVSLYHLEGGSYSSGDRTRYGRFNQWLHERRWGGAIEELMDDERFSPAVAATLSARPATQVTPRRRTVRPTTTVVVAGSLAQRPQRPGHAWVFLQYALGLRRLGHDVVLLDRIDEAMCTDELGVSRPADELMRWGFDAARAAELDDAYHVGLGGEWRGDGAANLGARIRDSIVLDVMGFLGDDPIGDHAAARVFVDLDPGFTQLWHELGDAPLPGADRYVTVGTALGSPDCEVPTCGVDWHSTLPPVVLERWPVEGRATEPFTTIGSWRGLTEPVEWRGRRLGVRAHTMRSFADLPVAGGPALRALVAAHPADEADLDALRAGGWSTGDPAAVAGDLDSYRRLLGSSAGEVAFAKELHVALRTGWFSDRSATFLASGRPVAALDTGVVGLPAGEGFVTFDDVDRARAVLDELAANPERHRKAARSLAEEHLDSDVVLARWLSGLGA